MEAANGWVVHTEVGFIPACGGISFISGIVQAVIGTLWIPIPTSSHAQAVGVVVAGLVYFEAASGFMMGDFEIVEKHFFILVNLVGNIYVKISILIKTGKLGQLSKLPITIIAYPSLAQASTCDYSITIIFSNPFPPA